MKKRRLKTLDDLRKWLADVANRLERGEILPDHARVCSYMASTMAGIIKDSDLETRITELEKHAEESQCH